MGPYWLYVKIFSCISLYAIIGWLIWQLWCLTFSKKWLYQQYDIDIALWIPLFWPAFLLVYIWIMLITLIETISQCKKKR